MSDTIRIRKAVLHILDNTISMPVLSDKEIDMNSDISDFLEKHIEKLFNDNNMKTARFLNEDNNIRDICKHLSDDMKYFFQGSIEISNKLFNIMVKNVDIAPGDLICCLFDIDSRPYLGILKLNYKTCFTHSVQQTEEGNANIIIRHKTILPSESQKIDECALIDLEDLSIKLLEKTYDINGKRDFYLSKLFLLCSTELSDNEKLKIIDRAAQKINRKFFDEDFDKTAKLKKIVSESLEETSTIQIDEIAHKVFDNNIEVQNKYIEEIQKAGLTEKTISIPEKLAEKKYRTNKIKTDTGIEINFPPSYYKDKEKIEFINNPDGTISIVIKNVGKIINR